MSTVERKKCDLFWPFLTTPDITKEVAASSALQRFSLSKFLETIETLSLSIIQEE